jgi:DNA adenine methylase
LFQPVIKWSGSKRSQSKEILKYFPDRIDTYYEPFIGGGSILRTLIESNIKVCKYICSDLNFDLIRLWNTIKENPNELIIDYKEMWNELNFDNDLERKKQYFYKVRERSNKVHLPGDFLFLMRTTTNGMPRYNNSGYFNNSFHITRNGINPETLEKIIMDWNKLLNNFNVEFIHCEYTNIQSKENDFLYLDPPYAGTKGMYYGKINYENLWKWMKEQNGKYCLSFDGKVNKQDMTYEVPKSLYKEHVYITSGNSSFRRIIGKSKDSIVLESLYIK